MWWTLNLQYTLLFLLVTGPLLALSAALASRFGAVTGFAMTLGISLYGLYGVGSWNVIGADTTNAEAKTFFANLKSKHNFDPDENALLAYAYADIFVRAVEVAGKDLTPQALAAALGTMKSTNPIFYDEKSFKGGHMVPETVRIEQAKGGVWTPVSGLLQ